MKVHFDNFLLELQDYFHVTTVDELATDLLHCSEVSLIESRFQPRGSLLDLFPAEYLWRLLPPYTRLETLTPDQVVEILEIIDKVVEPLIWMVYFRCGCSYRFPEFAGVTFSGPHRNVFIDDETKCLLLFTTYSKNALKKPLTKRLDVTAPKYLLYYIVILRQIQINLLGPE